MSDLLGNHIVGFPIKGLNSCNTYLYPNKTKIIIFEVIVPGTWEPEFITNYFCRRVEGGVLSNLISNVWRKVRCRIVQVFKH